MADSSIYQTILKKRPVYSDMGIIPDIFIPEDTVKNNAFWAKLLNSGAVDNFVLDDIDSKRAEYLKKYGTFQKFKNYFFADTLLIESLYVYLATDTTKNLKIARKEFDKCINSAAYGHICLSLKSRYAYFMFGPNESRMILNDEDEEYNTALRLINSPKEYYGVFN